MNSKYKSLLSAIQETVNSGENLYEKNMLSGYVQESKMKDSEVLSAAKRLAEHGKDEKAKKFGQGLVDFYEKNKSFTPDQVAGLQNIMKNASFQLAKEEISESKKQRASTKITTLSNLAYTIRSAIQHQEDLVKKGKEAEKKLKGLYADLKSVEAELKSL